MRAFQKSAILAAASLALVACTSGGGTKSHTGTAGAGAGTSGTAGAAAGSTGSGGTGTTAGAAGTITGVGGTTGTAGAAGGASGGAGSGGAGSTGAAGFGTDGGAGSGGGNKDGSSGVLGDGPTTTAGCANHNYQLCIDFENGIDTNVWSGGTPGAIVTDQFAHGGHSYHLYSKAGLPVGGRLLSKTVGTIKNQVWTRFYIHFSPGAPGGHGNIVAAYDQSGTWYEMGYQFDGMMGVWHGGGGEHPRRSKPYIVDQWYCVEAYFDGAAAAMPRWWIDGSEAIYYEPVWADGVHTTKEGGPTPTVSTQFTRMEAGNSNYGGYALKQPDTVGDQSDTRVVTDLWIDDVAFDTQRIGCIQ
jgi:hypothetical protein